jgi:hypothetical protein
VHTLNINATNARTSIMLRKTHADAEAKPENAIACSTPMN